MLKGHGLHLSEHLTLGEFAGGEGPDELPAVEDAELGAGVLDADAFAGESASDEDGVALERDLAAGADLAGDLPRLVGGFGEGGGSFAFSGPPELGGRAVAEGLVGSEGVVDAAPVLGVGVEVVAAVAAGVEVDELAGGGAVEAFALALGLGVWGSGGGRGVRGRGGRPGGSGGSGGSRTS